MRRRDFVTLIGGAMGWPLAAGAQQQATPVLGYLSGGSPDAYSRVTAAFLQGLKEAGYVERQNVAIEYRWAEEFVLNRKAAKALDLTIPAGVLSIIDEVIE